MEVRRAVGGAHWRGWARRCVRGLVMAGERVGLPELMPVLSRGRHRSPRRGACFMELASFLAGQRWSDHPACTHPLLAALARQVNDRTGDAGRQRLAGLIPSVIGLTGDDPRLDVLIAGRCARTAMAVAILTGERVLAGLDGRPAGSLSAGSLSVGSRQALDRAPAAARWARQFI